MSLPDSGLKEAATEATISGQKSVSPLSDKELSGKVRGIHTPPAQNKLRAIAEKAADGIESAIGVLIARERGDVIEIILSALTEAVEQEKTANRQLIIEIAKSWAGHAGVNWETTTTENLLLLIRDAVTGEMF